MKKWLMPILVLVIIIQLFVPAYMIINKYDILKTGEEFKFRVDPIDPYDAFRGRYVSLYSRQEVNGNGKYGTIVVDEDGFARVGEILDQKPDTGTYVKSGSSWRFSLPIDRYYMDEKFAPKAEALVQSTEQEAYVKVRIKNGALVISGLFLEDMAIEEIIRDN